MKVVKSFTVAALALLAACSNEENQVTSDNTSYPVDVRVSLNTNKVGTRAAMGDLQETVADQAAATLSKVHVYLVDGSGNITVAEEFIKDDAKWGQLVNAVPASADKTPGGYKFLDVTAATKEAVVICNPQGAIVQKGGKMADIVDYVLKSKIGEVIYADAKGLTTIGQESYGVNPQDDKRVVKAAEFTLAGNMNRFQILGTKFAKIEWTQSGKADAKKWQEDWIKANAGKTPEEALAAFVAHVGKYDVKTGASPNDAEWKKYFQVVDVTAENTGIVMNRFYNKFHVANHSSNELLEAKTYQGDRYDFATGTFKPDGKNDLSEAASYYNAVGFDFETAKKAAAFNFFSDKVTNYGKGGDAPTLHFIFKTGKVSENRRFLNVTGYTETEGQDAGLDAAANKVGKLLNIDLSKVNGGNGILVDADPTIPEGVIPEPGGKEDFNNERASVYVRVHVQPWVAVNVFPIL